jgi:hypothetical protein
MNTDGSRYTKLLIQIKNKKTECQLIREEKRGQEERRDEELI